MAFPEAAHCARCLTPTFGAGYTLVYLRTGKRTKKTHFICGGVERLTQIIVRPNESLDSALKRFKKQLQQTGILKEAREHEHYEKPSDKNRKARAAAIRKIKRNEEKEGLNK